MKTNIRVRTTILGEEDVDTLPIAGETVQELVERVLVERGFIITPELLEHFAVIYDGHNLEKVYWQYALVSEAENIFIAPVIRGGSFGQVFKQVALIAIAITFSAYIGPSALGLSGVSLGLATAGVTLGATLLLNGLIPPPSVDMGNLGVGSFEGSQMYTITSQSNQVKKYGFVPKVYGKHKMFPLIAANPYVEIEADSSTGQLVQYFYGLYDFGLGPLEISSIQLGDTPITEFSDVEYRLVDPNKPLSNEGSWDIPLNRDFTIYKGDVEISTVGSSVNKNSTDTGVALEDYQIIRNCSSTFVDADQEISLDFINPRGLIAYSTNGDAGVRNIDLQIHFSKVGEDNWIPYNDMAYVNSFKAVGGSEVFDDTLLEFRPFNEAYYTLISSVSWEWDVGHSSEKRDYGYPIGASSIVVKPTGLAIGDRIFNGSTYLGQIQSITPLDATYSTVAFATPFTSPIKLFESILYVDGVPEVLGESTLPTNVTASLVKRVATGGAARISRTDTSSVYSTFKFSPKEHAQYKVRVTRVNSFSTYSYQIQDALTLSSITTRFNVPPVNTNKRHVFLELKIRATNQLSGSVDNLSAICSSVLDVYDGVNWSKQVTSNPAWVYCDLLTGNVNKRAIDKSRLHMTSLMEWATFCDTVPTPPPSMTFNMPRFECNFVLDFDTTLQSMLNTVTNSAQASLNIVDGKYGVLIDKLKTVPVQIFTPRNSWDFSSTRSYVEAPHAVKVKFIDPASDWEAREHIVYNDGYTSETATQFEDMATFGCTSVEQAWRYGRYMLAQGKLRQELITLSVDFENLVCTRGDYVQITNDVMKVGGKPARVKSVSGSTITIDDAIDTIVGSYGYIYRNTLTGQITAFATLTVVDASTFTLSGTIPNKGDLIIIGLAGQVVYDCLVKSITPQNDLSAQIVLVEKSDAIYSAESSSFFPDYSPNLTQDATAANATPGEVQDLAVIENSWYFTGSGYQHYVDLDWDAPIVGAAYDKFEIYVNDGRGYNLVDVTKDADYRYLVSSDRLGIEHGFKVLAVSASGFKMSLIEVGEVFATPLRKTSPPSDVDGLFINITNEVMQLDWRPVVDADVRDYLIRYSPILDATWETSIPMLRVDKSTTSTSVQARTGTYLIKAVDWNDNESENAALALTSIPDLVNINYITQTNDFPTLLGSFEQAQKEGDTVLIQNKVVGPVTTNEFYSEGYYYYEEFLDLGDIYTVRLQSSILAEGYTLDDMMSAWSSLDLVLAMSNSRYSEWDVETQVRATDSFNVMSDWTLLSLIDPLNEGNEDLWTEWRKFTRGDFTGRIFQFRLKLISNKASVSPRVFDGVIVADMPDRVETINNLVSSASNPTNVTYSSAFKGPGTSPNIQITQDNASRGDYFQISNKTLSGFSIIFYDNSDIQVSRSFDVSVKGYGKKTTGTI